MWGEIWEVCTSSPTSLLPASMATPSPTAAARAALANIQPCPNVCSHAKDDHAGGAIFVPRSIRIGVKAKSVQNELRNTERYLREGAGRRRWMARRASRRSGEARSARFDPLREHPRVLVKPLARTLDRRDIRVPAGHVGAHEAHAPTERPVRAQPARGWREDGVRADNPQKLDQPKPDLLTRLGQLCLLRLVSRSGDVAAEDGARSLQQVVEGRVPPVDRKLDVPERGAQRTCWVAAGRA